MLSIQEEKNLETVWNIGTEGARLSGERLPTLREVQISHEYTELFVTAEKIYHLVQRKGG